MSEGSSSKRNRVWALPSSVLGWSSGAFLLLSVALVFVPAAQPLGLTLALTLALVTGVSALFLKKDRAWLILLAVGLPVLILGFEIVTMILPGAD